MVLGDRIRRNIALVEPSERALLLDALIKINSSPYVFPGTGKDDPQGGVTWWFKQDEIHQATHVHQKPEFVPWHRELVNNIETMLRQVNPQLSLHYWDWTENPSNIPNANLGNSTVGNLNLFTPDFMGYGGSISAPIGEPWLSAGFYVSGADPHRDSSTDNNPADPPRTVERSVRTGNTGVDDTDILNAVDYAQMRVLLEDAHDYMHGFVNMGGLDISFRDPFVFLLHSNVDRLFARWQTNPAYPERLQQNTVYGSESNDTGLNGNVEPWSTGQSSANTRGIRPWSAPENEGSPHNYKDPSIVNPPNYDTNYANVSKSV